MRQPMPRRRPWAILAGVVAAFVLVAASPAAAVVGGPNAFVWGYNASGGLGLAGTAHVGHPLPLDLPADVRALALGGDHSFALDGGGKLWAWGGNSAGQLGDGTTVNRVGPVAVALPGGVAITAADANSQHAIALDASGTVWAWGRNHRGQLGDGSTTDRPTPQAVALGTAASEIATGREHSFAVTAAGDVLGWGANDLGQLGEGSTTDRTTPVAVGVPEPVAEVVAGEAFGAARAVSGAVYVWGASVVTGSSGVFTPALAGPFGSSPIVALDAGDDFLLALDADGGLWSWGGNLHGQLGDSGPARVIPQLVALPSPVVTMAAGGAHVLALLDDGTLMNWGENSFGQLGDDATTDRPSPAALATLTDADVLQIALGTHSVGVLVDRGPLASLALSPATATAAPGAAVAYTVRGLDAFGTDLGPITSATLTISGGTCSATACQSAGVGRHTVTATLGAVFGLATLTVVAPGGGGTGGGPGGSGGSFGLTGLEITGVVILALLLLSLGLAAWAIGRRRRATPAIAAAPRHRELR